MSSHVVDEIDADVLERDAGVGREERVRRAAGQARLVEVLLQEPQRQFRVAVDVLDAQGVRDLVVDVQREGVARNLRAAGLVQVDAVPEVAAGGRGRLGARVLVVQVPLAARRAVDGIGVELDVRAGIAHGHPHFAARVLLERAVTDVDVPAVVPERELRRDVVVALRPEVAPGDVLLLAVGLLPLPGQAERELVVDRAGDEAVHAPSVEARDFRQGARPELPLRALVDIVDGSADGVAAVQGALRTAQHLDALEVVHGTQDAVGLVEVEVVRILGHGHVTREPAIQRPHPADRRGTVEAELQAGDADLEVLAVGDLVVLQHVAVERGDRNGNVEDRLLPAVGGDDDLFEHEAAGGLILLVVLRRQGRGGQGQHHRRNDRQRARPAGTASGGGAARSENSIGLGHGTPPCTHAI